MSLPHNERMFLARLGFFLCHEGQIPDAETIFSALAVSDPEKDGPAAGLALCRIIKGDCEGAIALLDKQLAKGKRCTIPGQLMLYKLLALGMAGNIAGAKALRSQMEGAGMTAESLTADLLLKDLASR